MTRVPLVVLLLVAALAGCASHTTAPLGVSGSIAVLPANNRTGEPLLVQGAGLIDRYVRKAERVSVADVLQSEARAQLKDKGFDVGDWTAQNAALKGRVPASPQEAVELARGSGITSRILYLEIDRWEADAPTQTRFVIVALTASLLDATTGQQIWREHRRASPVPTPGTITVETAYVAAVRKVIAEMLAPLRPAPVLQPQ